MVWPRFPTTKACRIHGPCQEDAAGGHHRGKTLPTPSNPDHVTLEAETCPTCPRDVKGCKGYQRISRDVKQSQGLWLTKWDGPSNGDYLLNINGLYPMDGASPSLFITSGCCVSSDDAASPKLFRSTRQVSTRNSQSWRYQQPCQHGQQKPRKHS